MIYRTGSSADFVHVETFVWQAIFPTFDHEDLNDFQRASNDAIVEMARERCLTALARAEEAVIVAWDEKRRELAGYILLNRRNVAFPEVTQLIVARRHWGKGVADALLRRGIEWLGADLPIRLGVIHYLSRAIRFFNRHGFLDSGEAFGETAIPTILMVREPEEIAVEEKQSAPSFFAEEKVRSPSPDLFAFSPEPERDEERGAPEAEKQPVLDFTAFAGAGNTERDRSRRRADGHPTHLQFEFVYGSERSEAVLESAPKNFKPEAADLEILDWTTEPASEEADKELGDTSPVDEWSADEALPEDPMAAENTDEEFDYDAWVAAAANVSLNELHAQDRAATNQNLAEDIPELDLEPFDVPPSTVEADDFFGSISEDDEPAITLDGSRGNPVEVEWDLGGTSVSSADDTDGESSASETLTMDDSSIAAERLELKDDIGPKKAPHAEPDLPPLGELRNQFRLYFSDLTQRLWSRRAAIRLSKEMARHDDFQVIVSTSLSNWRRWAGGVGPALRQRRLSQYFGDLSEYFLVALSTSRRVSVFPERLLRYQGVNWGDLDLFAMAMDYLNLAEEGETVYTDFITLSPKKLRNATENFLRASRNERIYFLVDQSILGNLKNGFAITDKGIFWKSLLQPNHAVYFEDLQAPLMVEEHLEINGHFFDGGVRLNRKIFLLLEKIRRTYA